ncbi:protein-disulfide reductase DsbD family protein [Flavisolibacter tropicus]|uniref:Protein-disulfide reductase n=1 Tax=Flavisolibacter tropicus TaxID=1492898 RepID=A0A172U1V9_9BACT|nr:thioredoxin family protein [Flavisolibacter tropicus]ANE53202.1 protein-disulfide reductase [Flavisolibacter tropicus]
MKKFLCCSLCLCLLFLSICLHANDSTDLKWNFDQQRINEKEVLLTIKASVPSGVKLYGLQKSENDALYSTITFDSAAKKYLANTVTEKGSARTEKDPSLDATVTYFADSVLWQQKVLAGTTDSVLLKGAVSYMYKKGEEYLPGEHPFKFYIQPEVSSKQTDSVTATNDIANQSLGWIFLIGFLNGLGALLTPCVFSMIPITVSFFTKRSQTKAQGKVNAFMYSASIIAIFTFIGFLITLIWGAAALNNLATNWVANLVFFALFLLFGISFLGAFEITLPSAWTNKADSKANTGSFVGIFFMALVLVLVSFSCTGPFIGNLLPIIGKGGYFGPLVGFFSFSLALALPFSLFAFFPSKLNVLGKAGGWLNAVKVTMGFVELALALKFLSNADLAKGWRLLDREIFIALWVVIFILLGVYLLGKLKFHHDDELPKNDFGLPYVSVTRLLLAITAISFSVYMIPGLWGAPLKGISAFVPPMGTQDFIASPAASKPGAGSSTVSNQDELPHPNKYYDKMHIYEPETVTKYGMVTYFDYQEALEVSRKLKKPLLLDFTGVNCVNCRKMEGQVWSDPEVMRRLKEDFVVVSLYVDVHNIELPQGEQYFSKALDKQVETLGDRNVDLQVSRFGSNTQPYYFFVDDKEAKLADQGYGYDPSIPKFIELLDKVKAEYNKRKA